ncbi:uncharacterized protein [Dermacentor albipictus]|uniref:uncharacterized protein n=1 Tax=Dermacentor albipictus TaxID=60249 RepID=UPI0038FCA3EE
MKENQIEKELVLTNVNWKKAEEKIPKRTATGLNELPAKLINELGPKKDNRRFPQPEAEGERAKSAYRSRDTIVGASKSADVLCQCLLYKRHWLRLTGGSGIAVALTVDKLRILALCLGSSGCVATYDLRWASVQATSTWNQNALEASSASTARTEWQLHFWHLEAGRAAFTYIKGSLNLVMKLGDNVTLPDTEDKLGLARAACGGERRKLSSTSTC